MPRPRRSCGTCGATFPAATEFCALDGAALGPVDEDGLVGASFDRYEIVSILGDGGMARVYRARHQFLEDEVAIKVLFGELAADRRFRARFLREGQTARKIRHPNVVDIIDFGEREHGSVFMVMELVEGVSLGGHLSSEPTPPHGWVQAVAIQVAQGLAAAHSAGVVHRDLKPHNVMLVDGDGVHVKLLDFGIARVESGGEGPTQLTRTGHILGTPSYMSPEQVSAGTIDHRSDLYGFGVLLYQMLTGRLPFQGDRIDILSKHLNETPPDPPHAGGLGPLTMQLLKKDPDERPASAGVVIEALEAMHPTADVPARPLVEPRTTQPPSYNEITGIEPFEESDGSNRTMGALVLAVALLVLGGLWLLRSDTASEPRDETPPARVAKVPKAPKADVPPEPPPRKPRKPKHRKPKARSGSTTKRAPPSTDRNTTDAARPGDLDEAMDRLFEGPPRPPHLVVDRAKLRQRMRELSIGAIKPGDTAGARRLASAQTAAAELNLDGAEAMARLCIDEPDAPPRCHALLGAILEAKGRPLPALHAYRAYLAASPEADDARRVKEIANALRAVTGDP